MADYPRHEPIEWEWYGHVVLGVAAGAIEICLESHEGDEVPVLQRGVGQVAELVEGGWSPPNTTTATVISRRATIVLMPEEPFWREVDCCSPARRLMRQAQDECKLALGSLAGNSLHRNPDTRVDHEIWRATAESPDGSAVFTQCYLARRARTDEPRVSKRLKALRLAGKVRADRRAQRVVALDHAALERREP
jgi:hypothetical protein